MRLHDDDEVYEIDGSYLGPPGRFIGVMRYKVIFLWLVIGPVLFWVVRMLDIELSLLTGGLLVIGITALVGWLADRITPERSISDLAGTFWADVKAPRASTRTTQAHGADLGLVGRPPARLLRPRRRGGAAVQGVSVMTGAADEGPARRVTRRRRLDGS